MTSWEALSFYAGIILPPSTSKEKKHRRIKEVLEMMGLAHARDTLVSTKVTCMYLEREKERRIGQLHV